MGAAGRQAAAARTRAEASTARCVAAECSSAATTQTAGRRRCAMMAEHADGAQCRLAGIARMTAKISASRALPFYDISMNTFSKACCCAIAQHSTDKRTSAAASPSGTYALPGVVHGFKGQPRRGSVRLTSHPEPATVATSKRSLPAAAGFRHMFSPSGGLLANGMYSFTLSPSCLPPRRRRRRQTSYARTALCARGINEHHPAVSAPITLT